jgi:hypothetical protein
MRRGLQIRARKPAGSVGFSFAFVGRGDPLILLLPFKAVLLAGPENLAAHRRSNRLSRSRGIPLITKTPGLLSPPGQRPQRAPASKGPIQNGVFEESALATRALAGIARPKTAFNPGSLAGFLSGGLKVQGGLRPCVTAD